MVFLLFILQRMEIVELDNFPSDLGFLILFLGTSLLFIWAEKTTRTRKENEPKEQASKNVHGSAGWAIDEEIMLAGIRKFSQKDEEGLWIGNGLMIKDYYHCCTIAPTREGKGTNLIIPNLLLKPHSSFVVTDPKGENACITAKWQKESGQKVYIIDPWNVQQTIGAGHEIPVSGFNPFDFITRNPEREIDNCSLVANLLLPDNPKTSEPYWNVAARNLIRVCLLHIISSKDKDQHNFKTLYNMLHPLEDEWVTLLVTMGHSEAYDGLVARLSSEFTMPPTENPMMSIMSTAQTALAIFESPQLRKSLSKSEFDPFELIGGKCTVYIVMDYNYLDTHSTWLRLIVGLCFNACAEKANQKVKFILDEFGILGKMEEVEKGLKYLAGKNITLWPFIQDLGTLKKHYGEEGMNMFVSGSSLFQAFGTNDIFTSTYVSKKLGKLTASKKSGGTSTSHAGKSHSDNWSVYEKDLLNPDEVERERKIITFYKKLKTRIDRLPYFEHPVLSNRADKRPAG